MLGGAVSASDAFFEALTEPDAPVPEGVVDPHGRQSPKRFAVYRNNVSVTLIEALGETYPVCKALVGEGFFGAMATVYFRQHKPISPLLFRYGGAFPGFVEGFEPAASVPYLADVARIEWAWLQAFHAADEPVASADMLATIAAERLGDARLVPHPAAWTLTSRWPAVTIVSRLREGGNLTGLSMDESEDALVTRPDVVVELRQLPPGAVTFLEALRTGTLGEAADAASAIEGFDLAANIAGLFEAGAITRVAAPDGT